MYVHLVQLFITLVLIMHALNAPGQLICCSCRYSLESMNNASGAYSYRLADKASYAASNRDEVT